MRHTSNHGFFLSVLLNLVLNIEWAVLAGILFGLHYWVGLPIYFGYIVLGGWFLFAVGITIFLSWAGSCAEAPRPEPTNKNPYSVGNKIPENKNPYSVGNSNPEKPE